MDKLGHLYDEVRGFRHDFAGIVASMEPAIANQDMAEVSTIYQDVFLKTNEKLRKADYTAFNLHNIHDIAIRIPWPKPGLWQISREFILVWRRWGLLKS